MHAYEASATTRNEHLKDIDIAKILGAFPLDPFPDACESLIDRNFERGWSRTSALSLNTLRNDRRLKRGGMVTSAPLKWMRP